MSKLALYDGVADPRAAAAHQNITNITTMCQDGRACNGTFLG